MVLSKMIYCTGKSAFTLLEILVAMMIFVIGSISIWSLYAAAIETYNRSVDDQAITFLAESIIAELKSVEVRKRKILQPIHGESKRIPGYRYEIHFQDLQNDAVFVTLKINYLRRGRKQEEVFYTVLYKTG